MNHWFLCARDTMWVILLLLPLWLMGVSLIIRHHQISKGWLSVGCLCMIVGVFWQFFGVALLWSGVIH